METNNQKNDQNIIPNDADKQQKGVNVPNLRFSTYSDNYESTTLENITSYFKSGKTFSKKLSDYGVFPIFGGNGIRGYSDEYNFDGNYILIGRQGALCGNIKRYNGKFYATEHAVVVKSTEDTDYLFYLLQHMDLGQYSGQSAQPGLAVNKLIKLICKIPSSEEQYKIGKFLRLIDNRIDTQNKIIENLELFKKGIWNYIYLTKSSDWKCVKLSDILCERKDFALKGDEFIHATLSKDGVFAKTDRYDRDFLVTNDEKEYKITRLNDICYNPANLKFGVICLNKFGDAIFSPIYVTYIVKNDFIPSFVELILTSSRFLKYIRKYEQGTVYERMAVNSKDFLKGEILIPTKDKQKAIADYFDMLDLKIKKEKDILELYKKQKAYLLKNMFI